MRRDVRRIDLTRLWEPGPLAISPPSVIAMAPKPAQDGDRDRMVLTGVGVSSETTEAEPLPPPSAEMVLIRVFVTSYLATAHERPRKRADAFLAEAARLLENEHTVALLLPIRGAEAHRQLSSARRQAMALFRQLVPTFVASLPGQGA